MVEIDGLTLFIGIGALAGSLLHVELAILFLKKNRESIISKFFITFFVGVAIGLFEIALYYLLPVNEMGMKLLYSSLYLVSMVGVLALVLGVRKLSFPAEKTLHTLMIPIMMVIIVVTFILTLTDVKHIQDPKNPVYTPLFMVCFIATFEVPLGYIIYQLTVKRDWISEERKKWFKNLRYFFIINSMYPVIESLSGMEPKGIRILDLGNGIFVGASLLLLYSLPNYKEWYLDELKTLTVMRQIKTDYHGSIEELWVNLELWQKEFEQEHKELTIPEFYGYLAEIETKIKTEWD